MRRRRSGARRLRAVWLVALVGLAGCAPPRPGAVAQAVTATHVLFLDLDGAVVSSGATDDAVTGVSELAAASAYPAFDPAVGAPRVAAADAVTALADRVRGYYVPFDLDVVTVRPTSGDFASVLVGGTGASLSPAQASGIAGIAPLDCGDNNEKSLGFAFADSLAPRYGGLVSLGAAIAHEAGHGYGLQHVTEPLDPMYSVAVPTQTLDDLFALRFRLGSYSSFAAGGGAPQPERCGEADPMDNDLLLSVALGQRKGTLSAAPTIAIDAPGNAAELPTTFPVAISAIDDVAVERVEIYANLELVAVLKSPPYETMLTLDPADSVTLTVEAVDADALRARASRKFAVRASVEVDGGVDAGTDATAPPVDAASCTDCAKDGGCTMTGGRPAPTPTPFSVLLLIAALLVARKLGRQDRSFEP